jgi:hypothetical protein
MRRLTAAVLALALAAAGCGGNEDVATNPERPAKPAITRAEFIKRLDELCRTNNADIKGYRQRGQLIDEQNQQGTLSNAAAMKQLVDVFDEVIPRYQTWIARARALDVPAGERAFLDRYVGTLDEQLALIKAGRDALDECRAPGSIRTPE